MSLYQPSSSLLLHRLALMPFRGAIDAEALSHQLAREERRLLTFILDNDLGPLWCDFLENAPDAPAVSEHTRTTLRTARHDAASIHLLQQHITKQTTAVLDNASVTYAVLKGSHLRHILYPSAYLRPSDDIDILVSPDQRDAAISALAGKGLQIEIQRANLSHEVTLSHRGISIDLHWDLFRPGRSRCNLAGTLLQRRREMDDIWSLDDSGSLLVMLVHPAFTKYVCGSYSKLVRLVDMDRMIRLRNPDWDWVLHQINMAGMHTAAWSTLYWLSLFLDTPLPNQILERIRPGRIQSGYLRWWIDHNLPYRLERIPLLVQGAFTLALHDRVGDALRAVAAVSRYHWQKPRIQRAILRAVHSDRSDGSDPG